MKWNVYERNYISMAKLKGKTDEYCIRQLEYAKQLFDKKVPIIYNQAHLCLLLGYDEEYVYAACNQPHAFYRSFNIPKKNGKLRRIDEPLPSLKEIQTWILNEILNHIEISPYAKAYIKGKSIKDNARFHRKQSKVLTMDISDFFPSISFNRVLHVFRKVGYRENVAVMLANLCCLDGSVPQGSPTSPMLSNIVASSLDYKIIKYIGKDKIRYTRYADDMTFSGDFKEGDLIKNVERIANREGFRINEEKTRTRYKNQRQEVTGIVVNEKMQISRNVRRKIRSDVYYIRKYGLESHMEHEGIRKQNYLYYLMGITSYALFINPMDEQLKGYVEFLRNEIINYKQRKIV